MKNTLFVLTAFSVFVVLHRFRGGGLLSWDTPIHRRFIVTPIIGAAMACFLTWQIALFIAMQYLILVFPPWGRWYTIGHGQRAWSGAPNAIEKALESATAFLGRTGSDYACFTIRNFACMIPTFALASYLQNYKLGVIAFVLAIAVTETYHIAWKITDELDGPTGVAEVLSGIMIAIAVICAILPL